MEYVYTPTANDTWDKVNLVFSPKVVLVEISCNDITINSNTKVSMYDAKTGALLASGQGKSNEKMYFKVAPKSYEAIFIVENNGNAYGKKVDNKTLSVNNLYKVELTSGNQMTNIGSSTVKYFTYTQQGETLKTYCIYGNGNNTIPSSAFSDEVIGVLNDIKSVIIFDGITTIGSSAFYSQDNIKSVIIPTSVTSIGDNAFDYCHGLENVYIHASLTRIGARAFASCNSNLTIKFFSLTPPGSLGTDAFGLEYSSTYSILYPLASKANYDTFLSSYRTLNKATFNN